MEKMIQLGSTGLQEKLNAALGERQQLLEEVKDLNKRLAAKEARFMELEDGGFNKGLTGVMDEKLIRAIANEVAAEHVKSHEIRFTLQGIFLVVLLGGLGLFAWVVGG